MGTLQAMGGVAPRMMEALGSDRLLLKKKDADTSATELASMHTRIVQHMKTDEYMYRFQSVADDPFLPEPPPEYVPPRVVVCPPPLADAHDTDTANAADEPELRTTTLAYRRLAVGFCHTVGRGIALDAVLRAPLSFIVIVAVQAMLLSRRCGHIAGLSI